MTTQIPLESFPLTWPSGQPRTVSHARKRDKFQRSWSQSLSKVLDEVRKLGGSEIVVSTNLKPRLDGLPYSETARVDDPGVAVWFMRKKKPLVLACDIYESVRANLNAVGLVIESLRAVERHGSPHMLEQAFTGFAALPAHVAEPSWWDVLGVRPEASLREIEAAHERLAQEHHPDRPGGDHERMARINRARDIARDERS